MDLIQVLLSIRWVRLFLVPVMLFLIGIIIAAYLIFFYFDSFTILRYNYTTNYSIVPSEGKLGDIKIIRGEFTAKENYLGEIGLRLRNESKVGLDDDKVLFRIKEKGQKKWYIEHTYLGGQFHELEIFPFGFPPISNSQNKIYSFEIQSVAGSVTSTIRLYDIKPNLVSYYQFPKQVLLHNRTVLISVLSKKITYSLSQVENIFVILFPFLPFILYPLFVNSLRNRKIQQKDNSSLYMKSYAYRSLYSAIHYLLLVERNYISLNNMIIVAIILFSIFIIKVENIVINLLFFVLWLLAVVVHKKDSRASFIAACFFLFICFIALLFQQKVIAEKTAEWCFIFMFFGVVQAMIALQIHKDK